MSPENSESALFEIGLVMAGAVSAGAYTAGVIDFLFQALDEWYDLKQQSPSEAPPHDIRLRVISGSSAGGMTAAVIAAMAHSDITHITGLYNAPPADREIDGNKLYDSWVEQIDLSWLLQTEDLADRNSSVKSILDSTVLDRIAKKALSQRSTNASHRYIADQLHLYLTLTNLQGVPYNIHFKGGSGKGHGLTQHTDHIHFILSESDPSIEEAVWLNPRKMHGAPWKLLQDAALATGAFPGGLAPRILSRSIQHYNHRDWPVPQRSEDVSKPSQCTKMVNILPSWPDQSPETFNFLSVDGGVMDNEPLELTRRTLADRSGYNARTPEHARRAVIMIDPFPNESVYHFKQRNELDNADIVQVFKQLFGSLMAQARFKPDELMLANSDEVYSRYMIAPTRRTDEGDKARFPIASGTMGGFGGFLSKSFRMHDFQLGRRNCQQFLRKYFAIPLENARRNPVFSRYEEEDFQRFKIERDGREFLPLIPLTGAAGKEAKPIEWNDIGIKNERLDELSLQITNRTKVVVNRLADQYIGNIFTRWLAKLIARLKRKSIVKGIMEMIEKDLDTFKLKT
ncbi:MAG: patatin-like phospholipase family protein [Balneolaceae bacterium]|nr:patatin-like phospholipase family protein [Balneolaceae bacterium]